MSMLLLTQPAPNLNAQNHLMLLTQQSAKSKSVCCCPRKVLSKFHILCIIFTQQKIIFICVAIRMIRWPMVILNPEIVLLNHLQNFVHSRFFLPFCERYL